MKMKRYLWEMITERLYKWRRASRNLEVEEHADFGAPNASGADQEYQRFRHCYDLTQTAFAFLAAEFRPGASTLPT